jgi:hypothetical protein
MTLKRTNPPVSEVRKGKKVRGNKTDIKHGNTKYRYKGTTYTVSKNGKVLGYSR